MLPTEAKSKVPDWGIKIKSTLAYVLVSTLEWT
jgi:hypothetical protein